MMISFLNTSQRHLAVTGRYVTKNSNFSCPRLLSSATTTGKQTNAGHHQVPPMKDDSERILDMYNNEKQSVLEDLDHPDNKSAEEPTFITESDANSIFDE